MNHEEAMMFHALRPDPSPRPGVGYRYAQAKRDGHRLTLHKCEDGSTVAFGRYRRSIEQDELLARYRSLRESHDLRRFLEEAPLDTIIDCEMWAVDESGADLPASQVKTALVSGEGLRVEAFAVPQWAGDRIDGSDLEEAETWARVAGMRFSSYRPLDPSSGRGEWDAAFADATSSGLEGVVLKQHNYHGWAKMKPRMTLTAIVTGFTHGRGKYLGLVGAIKFGLLDESGRLRPAGRVSGMTDDQRWELNETRDVGRVIEIEYERLDSAGGLRHPRFKRWRDDKPRETCTRAQISRVREDIDAMG